MDARDKAIKRLRTNEALEEESAELRYALKSLMPILQEWEPDYSSSEHRRLWAKAESLI